MKRKIGFIIALVAMLSMMLVPAGALAVPITIPPSYAHTFGPSGGTSVTANPGDPNTVDVIIEDTGDGWLQWTYTYSDTPTHTPKMTVAIDYPNGFCITTLDDLSGGWWYIPDPDIGTNRVQFTTDYAGGAYADWAVTSANGSVLTVRIKKSALGLSFMWHGYANVDGNQVWIETIDWRPVGDVTIDADTGMGLNAELDQIVAINVFPTSIDFGIITPGTPGSLVDIDVTNIGTVTVDVEAGLMTFSSEPTVFEYLKIGGAYPNAMNRWLDIFPASLMPSITKTKTAGLDVPVTYSARGQETVRLVFIATAAP